MRARTRSGGRRPEKKREKVLSLTSMRLPQVVSSRSPGWRCCVRAQPRAGAGHTTIINGPEDPRRSAGGKTRSVALPDQALTREAGPDG